MKKNIPIVRTINSDEEFDGKDSSDEGIENVDILFNKDFSFNFLNGPNPIESHLDEEPVQLFKDSANLIEKDLSDESNDDDDLDDDIDDIPSFDIDKFKDFKDIQHRNRPQNEYENYSSSESDSDNDEEQNSFFQSVALQKKKITNFKSMNLSRPILKVLSEKKFHTPTKIQQKTIPILLQGLDVCASAITGSGKTLSFLLPTIERLLHRNKKETFIRVMVLLPTRELAKQCFDVCQDMCKYTSIGSLLLTGGEPYIPQVQKLRQKKPCIIVCTPGRLISHMLNTSGFTLKHVEILILDEADKLLEMGFKDEFEEIIKRVPKNRQSMLFSATMTDDVNELSRVSLNHPVKIFINKNLDTPLKLSQEFIKIKQLKNEKNELEFREAILLSLCFRIFKKRVIIFVNRKVDARRLKVIFFLLGKKVSELHGDLLHEERISELNRFKNRKTNFLIATDLGARGLDILNVKTVINFYMPYTLNSYIHRVGRTARIGKDGVAVSLIDESSRSMLKQVVKRARRKKEEIKHRMVNAEAVKYYREKLNAIKPKVNEVLKRGEYEKEMNEAHKLLNDTETFAIQQEFDVKLRKRMKKKKKEILNLEELIKNKSAESDIIVPANMNWFQSKKELKKKKIREREEKQISKSGLKRVRNLLEDKILRRRKKKRRKLNDGEGVSLNSGQEGLKQQAKRMLNLARENEFENTRRKEKKKKKKKKKKRSWKK